MNQHQLFPREMRACYHNTQPRVINRQIAQIEAKLAHLGFVSIERFRSLEDPNIFPCDLLILDALHLPAHELWDWTKKMEGKLVQKGIQIPWLVLASVRFEDLSEMMHQAMKLHWFFDIVDPNHISSIPIRVANLIRIYDHLHQQKRNNESLSELQARCDSMENQLETLKLQNIK